MTSALRIVPAGTDDVDRIVDLVQSAYRGEASRAGWTTEADLLDGSRVDRELVHAAIGAPDTTVLLALDAGDPDVPLLGCCEVRAPGDGPAHAHFGMFAVSPQRQSRGVGSALLAAAERFASTAGAAVLDLWVIDRRHELIAWYRRRGYTPTGRHHPFPYGDERFGIPRRTDLRFAVMSKPLVPGDTRC